MSHAFEFRFRNLSDEEISEFRRWARENYVKFSNISGVWHPIVQLECVVINSETGYGAHITES